MTRRQGIGPTWSYLLLGVALLGALGFGWQQNRQRAQLARVAENKYMSAFHKLKWTSENIEERMARLMATNDASQQESLLADLRVFSAQAVEHMSVLPLITANIPQVTSFLNNLRETSDELHHAVNLGDPLTDENWEKLANLRRQSVFFEEELAGLLGLVGNNMIRWNDTVRVTGFAATGDAETPITKSVMALNTRLEAPPGQGNVLAPGQSPMAAPRTDPGPRVGPEEAVQALKRFVDMPLAGEPVMTGVSDPEDKLQEFSLYFFDAKKENGVPLSFGISVHGGHVIFMLDGRPVNEKRFSLDQLIERGREILSKRGYPDIAFVSAAENAGTLIMDWAPRQDGVAIHTEIIKLSLTMDNGEMVGFDARNHWVNRHQRNLGAPKLTSQEAARSLAPKLQVMGEPTLAIVANRRNEERLVWSFRARLDDQSYLIFKDANDGREVSLLRLGGDPAPAMNIGQ